ncbi:hypothetical protein GB931_16295 [Modestobacter sp. I12A-02628]|uniref:DUF3592 domain-containing protein n=1 Tax=Goekera deserti TaxID=2497753 RepID=A0A7K3WGM2_9ACTN|nr:DUF3592 domain-containing protein [Goekera deserti]MPQ99449.1 hypothetical protein [Goekera deserti]NDI48936.1 hypothetical protein [Goekera deserti]NEL55594.1 hypothetical protein [Goekera deserti]
MTSTPPPRPHRRAVGQLLLGLVPLVVVGLVLTVVLVLRLGDAQAPLSAATRTATATVTASGTAPDGRGVDVTFTDADGRERPGRLVLDRPQAVPTGNQVTVAYAPGPPPSGPQTVYADGDAAHGAVGDVVFGLVLVPLVTAAAAAVTGLRVLGRRRLRRAPATRVPATHFTVRRGLLVRSWLELDTPRGLRWLPVHWAPELAALPPDTRVEVRGDPGAGRVVLPVVAGAELWPSGRLRPAPPRGELNAPPPRTDAARFAGLARQARGDAVVPVLAPVLGLLWAYVDDSGVAGFVVASALAAALLFWVQQFLGSSPALPAVD